MLFNVRKAKVVTAMITSMSINGVFAKSITANDIQPYVTIPSTISLEAQSLLSQFTDPILRPAAPEPDDIEGWIAIQESTEAAALEKMQPLVEALNPDITTLDLGGVPVLDIRPHGWKESDKVIVYTHGGAYTLYSAHSTLNVSALTAHATGYRVLSIDYTLAPHAKWNEISDEIMSVFKALIEQGYNMSDIAFLGDSAGGGLASTTTLRLRDEGYGMPAALVLYSPMADITTPGDSYSTLAHAEPMYRLDLHVRPALDAYADPKQQRHPYVSSVYGDFNKGFPATLIQAGTKELVLSSPVRLYQAMDTAGVDVKLDIYEGMPHVFQTIPGLPEGKVALGKVDSFLKQHLGN